MLGLWGDSNTILSDLHVLTRLLFEASGGRPVVAAKAIDTADVVLAGHLGLGPDKVPPVFCAARARGAVTIYFTGENDANFMPAEAVTHFVDLVDVSFGMRADVTAANYLRAPIWLFYPGISLGDGDTFVLPAGLTGGEGGGGGAVAWRARPRFAALVARDTGKGARPALLALFDRLRRGRVRLPSAGGNMPWPACLPNNAAGKVAFFRTARFALVPENSVTPWGGYTTEKLMHALSSGAVPVYWGDWPPDPNVFNSARVLRFDGTAEGVALLKEAA